jgi:hypothetical protein
MKKKIFAYETWGTGKEPWAGSNHGFIESTDPMTALRSIVQSYENPKGLISATITSLSAGEPVLAKYLSSKGATEEEARKLIGLPKWEQDGFCYVGEKKVPTQNERYDCVDSDIDRRSLVERVTVQIESERNKSNFGSLDYSIGDPIKNSDLLHEQSHPLQNQNFLETAQILWHFRKHPEYFGYDEASQERLFDLLGIESKGIKQLDNILSYRSNGEIFNDFSKPSLLTDLIFSFRKRAKHLPQFNTEKLIEEGYSQEDISSLEGRYKGAVSVFDSKALALYRASIYLPFIEEDWQLGFNVKVYAPSLCDTPEKMKEFYKKAFSSFGEGNEMEGRVKQDIQRMEKWGMKELKNLNKRSLDLVREYAPKRYERFSEAVSRA